MSRKYLLKFFIYGILLVALLLLYWFKKDNPKSSPAQKKINIEEIEGVRIEPESQELR